MTIGCDLSDKYSEMPVLNENGEVVEQERLRMRAANMVERACCHSGRP